MLPEIKKVKLSPLTLPTAWQTVIFRNYGYVRAERIAKILGCDKDTVRREAERLCLFDKGYYNEFEERGYITVIRDNWYLLPYEQLITLLGISAERFDFILKNDDFLDIKLGNFKPECEEVKYSPLTEEEIKLTEKAVKTIKKYTNESKEHVRPFDFFAKDAFASDEPVLYANGKRIVHGYLSPCADAFMSDCSDTLPDVLLEKYRSAGINGIWLHGLLSSLSPYPFCPALSEIYKIRRKNLNKIIERCARYGIKLYLYFNEPRALPVDCDKKYESLIGYERKRTLCLQKSEVREYLYTAVKDLCESAVGLGGIFTITMSENPTHCNYSRKTDCPVCKNISPENSASDVNNIIYSAIRDSGSDCELIANLWGWSPFMNWSDEQVYHGIELLDKNISVMCVSEYDLAINKGGIESRVIDYSISNPGPSDIALKSLSKSRECGHKLYAKIQASNSWECSCVPYLPVFDLVYEHIENLKKCTVEDHFLTWTLGGYPSPSISLTSSFSAGSSLEEWYERKFGKEAKEVHGAVKVLCDAFREFPFHIKVLYMSPKNLGPANMWDIEAEEKTSSMVCYSFDDIENWTGPYPYDVYVSQLEKLCDKWSAGIELLENIGANEKTDELIRYAKAALAHWRSDLHQTRFAYYKRLGDKTKMLDCVKSEKQNAEELLGLIRLDAKIGFEASNHYFYTERDIIEKILRMEKFENLLN